MNKKEIEEIKKTCQRYQIDDKLTLSVVPFPDGFIFLKLFSSPSKSLDTLTCLKVIPVVFDSKEISYENILTGKTYNYDKNYHPFREIIEDVENELLDMGHSRVEFQICECSYFKRDDLCYKLAKAHKSDQFDISKFEWRLKYAMGSNDYKFDKLKEDCAKIEAFILINDYCWEKTNSKSQSYRETYKQMVDKAAEDEQTQQQ